MASLRNCPTSPQKMRELADTIRGKDLNMALDILRYNKRAASRDLEKLVKSALHNWKAKNEGSKAEDSGLIIKMIHVDGGRMLRRIQPAPQGRAHRIRKRSNHVTMVVDSTNLTEEKE